MGGRRAESVNAAPIRKGTVTMAQRVVEQRVENLERRVASVEQVPPAVAAKGELPAAIAPQAEVSAEAELTRRHFEVVGEGLRADLRKIAEGQTATLKSIDAMRADLMRLLQPHDA